MNNFFEIKNATFKVSDSEKVKNVSFSIKNEGDIVCLLGPSGIGSYHGEEGFKTFSNAKAVYKQVGSRFDKLLSAIRPPYKGDIEKVLKQIT